MIIDDYSPWVTGPNITKNVVKLQNGIIPQIDTWIFSSGANLQAKKADHVHLTCNKARLEYVNADMLLKIEN